MSWHCPLADQIRLGADGAARHHAAGAAGDIRALGRIRAPRCLPRRGVLLTRLSAAHEAAAMDVLCADKTGTLDAQ